MSLLSRLALMMIAALFAGLSNGEARAQEHAEILQSFGPRFVVFRDKVQDELKLSAEQKSKLNSREFDFVQEAREFLMGLQDAKPEERQKKHMEYAQKANAKLETLLKETLKDDQIKRARQIAQYPWFLHKKPWQKELDLMLKNGFKLEVEALISKDISYVTEQYVPERLEEGNFLD